MSNGTVRVAPDSTGKHIDASELLVGANTVERQRVVIGDDSDAAGLAQVATSAPAETAPGLVTRDVYGEQIRDLVDAIGYLAVAIHDRMPISDTQERVRMFLDASNGAYVNHIQAGYGNPSTGATVYMQHAPYNFMAMDAARLYAQIEVT